MRKFFFSCLLFFFGTYSLLIAQGNDKDIEKEFEGWFSISYSKEFDFNGELSFEQQIRLFEYSETFTEAIFKYELLDFLTLGTEARVRFYKGGNTGYRIAPFLEISGSHEDLKLSYELKNTNDFDKFSLPKSTIRNSLEIKYDIKKKWRVQTGVGMFVTKKGEDLYFSRFRWTIGSRYKINKKNTITVFYRVDKKFDDDGDIEFNNILGMKYNLKHK